MRIFNRRPSDLRPSTDIAAPVGTLPCSARGCANSTAIVCSYHDRRARTCEVAFCPEHWSMVGGVVYCRRHAGTVSALAGSIQDTAYPELQNRGPSLVNWIADELSADVEGLLRAAAHHHETVKTEKDLAVIFDNHRHRRWERSWKLIEPTGIGLKVAVTVSEEGDDALVDIRVGSNVIARGVPPWIARRRAGVHVDDEADADQRKLFHRFFIEHIVDEIAVQRPTTTSLIA